MRLTQLDQAKWWGIAALVFLIVLWFMGNVILPFLVGGAIAYFLDPIADRLEKLGLSRPLATAVIAVLAVMIFVLLVLAVIPTLVNQLTQLINVAPDIFTQLQTFLTDRLPQLSDETSTIRQALDSLGQVIQQRGGQMADTIITSFFSVVSAVVFMIVVPVVAFYMLLDWDKMVTKVDTLLPLEHAPTIRELAREIDRALAGFVRGQTTVCLILGIYYAVALMVAGLNFGAIVGAIAGFLTFIPYVGALVGGGLAIGLALFQYWGDWWQIIIVWAIFQSGQFVEGNILTPRLVGNSIGLHPVWLLFALSAFGSLFGFVGMLVAVPVAAAIGVLARFAMAQYRASRLYHGAEDTTVRENQG
ncbi:AI-2E family transporter [Falsirhodobacter deserti]|uniref:AI-2E family transporter n=1 Tax=Falsirhodobacter deserti TaxID=1365611 RepID=UPI000FE3CD50|nr:AI-2E family transporter [Falsirhodobacter deserti]